MKDSTKKKLVPFVCGTAVLGLALASWIYVQWRDTQTLFFDTEEQITSSTEAAASVEDVVETEVEEAGAFSMAKEPDISSFSEDTADDALALQEDKSPTTEGILSEEISPDNQATSAVTNDDIAVDTSDEAQFLIDEAIVQLYDYKTSFLSALDQLYTQAKEEYQALPVEERTAEVRESMMFGYAIEGSILESECDSLVLTLLIDLTNDLERLDASTDIVNEMKEQYIQEKTEKKAEYLAVLGS